MALLVTLLRMIVIPLVLFIGCVALSRISPDFMDWPEQIGVTFDQVTGTLIWLSGAWLAIRVVYLLFWQEVVEHALGTPAPRLMVQLGNVLILLLAVSGVLTQTFNQSVSVFWTASGALGLVVAFALRQLILDTFSGIAIHVERPFKVGDWIKFNTRLGVHMGQVTETNWRTTRLWTNDRNMVVIPNSVLTTSIFTNLSMPDRVQRFYVDFIMDFAVPPERVKRVLEAAAQSAIGEEDGPVPEPAPEARVHEIGNDGVTYRLFYFCAPPDGASSRSRNVVMTHALLHIDKSGLSLNYRKTDVYLANMPWRQKAWNFEQDQIHQLSKLFLFRGLESDDLAFLAERMELEECAAGSRLVEQGEQGDSMYILAEGLLEVDIRTEQDELLKVAALEPGSFFGEKSLLTGEPRSATIIAATDVLVCRIDKPVMADLLDRNVKVAEILSRAVVERDLVNSQALAHQEEEDAASLLDAETGKFMDRLLSFFGKT